jgi:tripartite ATP-independent transporter DctP family solute receptor
MKRIGIFGLLSLFCLLWLNGCQAVKKPPVWRFAIEETSGSVQDAYAQKFKELVEEKSNGEVRVKVYPYGTLGTSDQLSELLYNGSLQFAMASPGHIGKMIPEVQVLLLHYVLSDDDEINKRVLANPEVRAKFDELFAAKDFKLLAIISEGWQVWTANKPIESPDDFSGVKFRVMTSPLLMAAYDAYGASSTPLAFSEVYSALQLKMVDGQVNPVFAIEEMSFFEVNDHLIFANQAQFYSTCLTNREFYDSLTEEEKRWVDESIAELQDYIFDTQRQFNEERLQIILEKKPGTKVIHLTSEQRDVFREASVDVRRLFVETVGPQGEELLEVLEAAVEKETQAAGSRS